MFVNRWLRKFVRRKFQYKAVSTFISRRTNWRGDMNCQRLFSAEQGDVGRRVIVLLPGYPAWTSLASSYHCASMKLCSSFRSIHSVDKIHECFILDNYSLCSGAENMSDNSVPDPQCSLLLYSNKWKIQWKPDKEGNNLFSGTRAPPSGALSQQPFVIYSARFQVPLITEFLIYEAYKAHKR